MEISPELGERLTIDTVIQGATADITDTIGVAVIQPYAALVDQNLSFQMTLEVYGGCLLFPAPVPADAS